MPEKEMTSLDRIDIMKGLLDKLVEAQGRAKAGYITVIDDFLNKIRDDLLVKEAQIQDLLNKEKVEPMSTDETTPIIERGA